MNKMKALVKSKKEPGLWLEDVPVPEPDHDEVLIRIRRTAICGTDVHIYNWDEWSQATIPVPMHIGHEFVGVVEEVGTTVKGFKQGDLVSGEGHLVCGHCRNCLAGRRHENRRSRRRNRTQERAPRRSRESARWASRSRAWTARPPRCSATSRPCSAATPRASSA